LGYLTREKIPSYDCAPGFICEAGRGGKHHSLGDSRADFFLRLDVTAGEAFDIDFALASGAAGHNKSLGGEQ
jgi:hypothetical protein